MIVASMALLLALVLGLLGTKFFAEISVYIFFGIMTAITIGIASLYFGSDKELDDCEGRGFIGPSYDTLSDNWYLLFRIKISI